MELIHLLFLTTRFAVRQDVVWDIRCNTGSPNICELIDVTLTADIADLRTFFPATNLRMIDGWIPVFDATMAGMLRKETKVLVIMRCYVQYFVVREMLKVLILTSNAIRNVRLIETGDEFEMEFMKLDKNQISDISFVSRMEKLHYLDVSENKLQILNIELFQNLKNLSLLELRENQIQKIEASSMLTFPVKLFGIANNQIADLNIKNWRAPNITSFSVQVNKLQSINTVQLLEAFPRMSSFQYDENPWNCERLKSLQFYIKMRPHKVYNFTRRFATCHDRDMVNNVALKLPELIDLSERKLGDLGGRIRQLIEGNGEGKQLASLQFRVAKTQQILGKMSTGLGKLENTHDKIKRNVDWLDFFDKLNW
ncbi:leucine-rich repeat-containing protein 40 [Culex quinquefasciatus]|uniref:leucine-rich repeat-containing protein 40 n=1 Tax=Culex quinquefasciatus TaxID=7176 RepID=UPI0018E2E142|nr:leucine-rich repeat-containing protein 40 [Culex quinquefasciatus]